MKKQKNEAASALGKLSAKKRMKGMKKQEISEHFRQLRNKGFNKGVSGDKELSTATE